MPSSKQQELETRLRLAVKEDKGIDSTAPFVVCKEDPQGGWYLTPARNYAEAERLAHDQSGDGKFEVFVLPTDPKHGLMKLHGHRLEPA